MEYFAHCVYKQDLHIFSAKTYVQSHAHVRSSYKMNLPPWALLLLTQASMLQLHQRTHACA